MLASSGAPKVRSVKVVNRGGTMAANPRGWWTEDDLAHQEMKEGTMLTDTNWKDEEGTPVGHQGQSSESKLCDQSRFLVDVVM